MLIKTTITGDGKSHRKRGTLLFLTIWVIFLFIRKHIAKFPFSFTFQSILNL